MTAKQAANGVAAPTADGRAAAAPQAAREPGQFDPRDAFFPQSLMREVQALEVREGTKAVRPLLAKRYPRPVDVVVAVAVAVLVAGAYWFGREQAASSAKPAAAAAGVVAATDSRALATAAVAMPAPAVTGTVKATSNALPDAPRQAIAASPPPAMHAPESAPAVAKVESVPVAQVQPAPASVASKAAPVHGRAQTSSTRSGAAPHPAFVPVPAPVDTAPVPFTGGVTHTRSAASVPQHDPVRKPSPSKQGKPSSANRPCAPELASLGLCAPPPQGSR